MPFESMDDFIKAADQVGEVLHVDGADLELDVGGLTELTAEKNGPMVVFDKFAGYPGGLSCRRQCQPHVAPVCPGDGFAARHSSTGVAAPLARQARRFQADSSASRQRRTRAGQRRSKAMPSTSKSFPRRAGIPATAAATSAPRTW